MAQREDFLTDSGAGSTGATTLGGDRSSDQIRSDIDRTRAELDETFSALESKLTPGQILEEAWGMFKGGSSAGVTRLMRVVREHPMPAAVIGLGAGWLLVESSRRSDRDNYYRDYGYGQSYGEFGEIDDDWESESSSRLSAAKRKATGLAHDAKDKVLGAAHDAREAVSGAADTVGEKASHLKDQALSLGHRAQDQAGELRGKARKQVRRARTGFWQTMEENPLVVGAATLALGVIAGLLIPSTDAENELMGETRDQLLDQAKELGHEALDKGKQVASTVADRVKDEAQHQGLTPQNLVDKVKTVAQEASNVAKEEVKKQAPALAGNDQGQGGQQGGQGLGGQQNAGQASNLGATPPPVPAGTQGLGGQAGQTGTGGQGGAKATPAQPAPAPKPEMANKP